MRIRFPHLTLVVAATLMSASLASAQPLYNPIASNPYSRPWLSPYLNLSNSGTAANTFYRGVLEERALRNEQLRPFFGPEFAPASDISRSPGYQSVGSYQNAEDWVNQRIRETQLSPSGHPTGFLVPTPYYRTPNQRSFVPHNPASGPQPK